MIHYLFLWRIIGLVLGFGALVTVWQVYQNYRLKPLLLILFSICFSIARTTVFALSSYSRTGLLGIFARYFDHTPTAGLIYMLLLGTSAALILPGSAGLLKVSLPRWVWWFVPGITGIAVLELLLVRLGCSHPLWSLFAWWPRLLLTEKFLVDYPVILIKTAAAVVLTWTGLRCAIRQKKDNPAKAGVPLLFLCFGILGASGQILDLMTAFSLLPVPAGAPVYRILQYSAVLILLKPVTVHLYQGQYEQQADLAGNEDSLFSFIRQHGLDDEEIQILKDILEGKSNKEIAYERQLSLSQVKHRIHKLFKQWGISRRYELFSLMKNSG